MIVPGNFPQFLKDKYIGQLTEQECRERPDDNSLTLPKDFIESKSHIEIIAISVTAIGIQPPGGWWKFNG